MGKKPAGIFKKKYKEKDFKSKILAKTFSEKDNEYLLSLFEKDDKNIFSIKREIGKDDARRLTQLGKTIKGNTGIVLKGRLIVIGAIVAGVILFNVLFKDMLLENALEAGLTQIFTAKADVTGLSFDIFGARLSLASLAVANRDLPMTNLFELGNTEIDFRMSELLKNKFVVENIRCEAIAWGTARKTSGGLAKIAKAEEVDVDKTKPAFNAPEFSLAGIDAGRILESQKNLLESPVALEESTKTLSAIYDKWKGKPDALSLGIKDTAASVDAALAIKIRDIKTAADVEKAYKLVESAVTSVAGATKDVKQTVSDFGTDLKAANDAREKALTAIAGDYDFLSTFISAPKGGAKDLLASQARYILARNLGDIYGFIGIGLDAIAGLRAKDTSKKAEPENAPRRGADIDFPGTGYPKFLIENASFSIGKPGDSNRISVVLGNISSSPDKWPHPIRLEYGQATGGIGMTVKCTFDADPAAAEQANVAVGCTGLPFTLPGLPAAFGIKSLSFDADFLAGFDVSDGNAVKGNVSVLLSNIKGERSGGDDLFGTLVSGIVLDSGNVRVNGTFKRDVSGGITLSLGTSLDELVVRKVGKMIDDSLAQAKELIRKELEKYLGKSPDRNADVFKDIEKIGHTIADKDAALAVSSANIENKKKEIEAQAKAMIGNEAQKALGGLFNF